MEKDSENNKSLGREKQRVKTHPKVHGVRFE